MKDIDLPSPNPALAAILLGSPMRRLVQGVGEQGLAIYREIAHKRTGRTARDARVETYIGGRRKDRWKARLVVNQPTSTKAALSDLNQVLNRMSQL